MATKKTQQSRGIIMHTHVHPCAHLRITQVVLHPVRCDGVQKLVLAPRFATCAPALH